MGVTTSSPPHYQTAQAGDGDGDAPESGPDTRQRSDAMSHVELPLVPSARSTSASSSRSSLRSAGSDQSSLSARSRGSQRSLADAPSDDDGQQQQEDDGQGEEEPQEASGGLWDEVESFLNKPSPSLSALAKAAKKQSAVSAPAKSVLPNLKAEAPRRNSQGDNQARPSRPARAAAGKTIDPKLLEEAFAYARRAQAQMMHDEDADEDEPPVGGRARPIRRSGVEAQDHRSSSSSSLLASNVGRGDSSGNARGAGVRAGKSREADKPKKKTAASSSGGGAYGGRKKSERRPAKEGSAQWKTAAEESGGAEDARKGRAASMDAQTVQELVSSLQQGTALEELRRELAASQQSLALSRQALHEAAKTFFQPS